MRCDVFAQCGEAMSLDCQCRGELALRHRSCAEKWSRVKVRTGPCSFYAAYHKYVHQQTDFFLLKSRVSQSMPSLLLTRELPVQGDRVCDVCKSTINNLPEVTPPAPTEAGSDAGNSLFDDMDDRHAHPLHSAFVADQMPGSADIVFDCIRVRLRSSQLLILLSGCSAVTVWIFSRLLFKPTRPCILNLIYST